MARDVVSTRSRLLSAARTEFAAHGIAGARVDRIAALAEVNKERIYGHFGSKEALFDAVIAEAKVEHVRAIGLPSGDLAEYVGKLYDQHRDDPLLLRLMMWEALHESDAPPANYPGAGVAERERHYDEKVAALATALGIEPTLETAATLLTLIGLAAWPHALPQLARLILHAADSDAIDAIVRTQVVEFARRALPQRQDSE